MFVSCFDVSRSGNLTLRRLLEKGPKYREQNIIDWHLNKEILITAIDDYAKNWSKREGYHVSALEEWSETVKLIISNRFDNEGIPFFRLRLLNFTSSLSFDFKALDSILEQMWLKSSGDTINPNHHSSQKENVLSFTLFRPTKQNRS